MERKIEIWTAEVGGYKLLDSGNGFKLEEVGGVRIVRSEPRALWKENLPEKEWQEASASFGKEKGSKWKFKPAQHEASVEAGRDFEIPIGVGSIKAKIKFGVNSKHIGIFPEQASEWKWLRDRIMNHESRIKGEEGSKIKVLNLFGYTGIASLVCAEAGAEVTHVDASKASIEWAKENQKISGLTDKPIRFILDDCLKFLSREISKGNYYDAIIMDPPSFGHGPKGEKWKIEEKLPELLKLCKKILSDEPLFIIFNMYATDLSAISLENILGEVTKDLKGQTTIGELALKEEGSTRLLPLSIFAIWEK